MNNLIKGDFTMKKNLMHFLVVLFMVCSISSIYAQSISFTPYNGQTITIEGTYVGVYVGFSYEYSFTQYPPGVSIAAFAKLTTDYDVYYWNLNNTNYSNNYPQGFTLFSEPHTWTIELYELFLGESSFVKTAYQTNTFYVNYKLYAANNFGSGSIDLEGSTVSSGSSTYKIVGESMSVGAIDQNDGSGYYRIWNTNGSNNSIWYKNGSQIQGATSRNLSYTVGIADNGATLIAYLRKVCDLTFQANSSMYINGFSRSSGWTESVVEQNSIYASANGYTSNGIEYTFDHWTKSGQSFSSPVTATAHGTYTAVYTGKPTNSGEYASAGGTVGQPVVVTWTDNPNTAVNQFQIWRRVKHNSVVGSDVLLTTVGRGVQTYTDNDYAVTSGYTHDLLWYDVRAYYSTEGTYSDPDWTAQFGRENANIQSQNGQITALIKEIPTEYSINNYPNPFNPTTTINYQLPEYGFVTIKVYDMLGKEVTTLVNENKSAGYHRVNFDASKLTSGVYVYIINANNFVQSKKMLLMK
jgi:hypothetical protein